LFVTAFAALVIPLNLAFNLPPSPVVLNDATAWVGWGLFLVVLGWALRKRPFDAALVRPVAWALVACGVLGTAVGGVQIFAPHWPDGMVVANSTIPGRATGNLRQPNSQATVLLWALVSVAWLFESGRLAGSRARGRQFALAAAYVYSVFGIVLTASRTGAVGLLVLAGWGLLDRRLGRATRLALTLSPLVYAVLWWVVGAAQASDGTTFAGTQRLVREGLSTSRWAIWANTLELIRMHPWTGVGVGEFNFAWTLTEFSQPRPPEFFDHSHNLVLQLWVELGLPLGSLVLTLMGYALWRAFRAPAHASDAQTALMQRCAFMIVLLALMHSMLEYPLWYPHLALPVVFFWGLALVSQRSAGGLEQQRGPQRYQLAVSAGVLLLATGLMVTLDFLRVVQIFDSQATTPLPHRIQRGQNSLLFGRHGDYALVTVYPEYRKLADFRRPTHAMLDARLMRAWAETLAASGDVDRARWVAARLHEFSHPSASAFFAMCDVESSTLVRPFQCEAPQRRYTFEDFR
jgi:O-antigen ligase